MGMTNSQGQAAGTAAGAAIGTAFAPGVGTYIGGALGGALGGMLGSSDSPPPPAQLPVPNQVPNISGVYGGMYRDPITGQISFSDTYNNPYFFQQFQNQALMDQLMGNHSQSANSMSGLDSQIGLLGNKIKALQDQMGQKVDPTKSGLLPEWLDANGKLKSLDQVMGEANSNSSWLNKQYLALGGHYGKGGFAQFIKDAYTRNIQPAYDKYQKDLTTQQSSNGLIQQQIDALNAQLGNYQKVRDQYAPGGQAQQQAQQSATQNPLLSNISSMEDIASQMRNAAGNGAYLQQAQGQIGNQIQNSIAQAENDAARRGLSGSSISEMMRARLGLEGAQALNSANWQQQQNSMGLLGQAQGATQNALQARLGLVQNLQGLNNNAFNQGLQAQQMNLGQLQLGSGVGAQNASALNGYAMGNVAQQNQYNMGLYNSNLANQMQNQNNWGQAVGAIGYGLSQIGQQPEANYRIYNPGLTGNTQAPYRTDAFSTPASHGFTFGDMPATAEWSSKLGGK